MQATPKAARCPQWTFVPFRFMNAGNHRKKAETQRQNIKVVVLPTLQVEPGELPVGASVGEGDTRDCEAENMSVLV